MSEWRDIWAESIKANKHLIIQTSEGEKEFLKLIMQHPNDGMIFYSRGEAYEYLVQYEKARLDYESAFGYFPVPHWKRIAHEAIDRVRKNGVPGEKCIPVKNLADFLHRIYSLPKIPVQVSIDSLSAIERFDSEPHLSSGLLRICLEELINEILLRYSGAEMVNSSLIEKIDYLRVNQITPSSIISKMNNVKRIGNKGIHPGDSKSPDLFTPALEDYSLVLEWANRLF